MPRLIAAIVVTVFLVAFALANTHRIELSFVFGRPAEVRLIFLLGTTYLVGIGTGVLWSFARRLKQSEAREHEKIEASLDLVKE